MTSAARLALGKLHRVEHDSVTDHTRRDGHCHDRRPSGSECRHRPDSRSQFAALLTEDKAQQLANTIKVAGNSAHVVSTNTAGSPIFRVVMGPFATKEEAERIGRASKREYWIYEGSP